MPEVLLILCLIAVLLFWIDTVRSKELAIRHGKSYCSKYGLQLLDDTVAQTKLSIKRRANGRMGLLRHYQFEFCTDGRARYPGWMKLMGFSLIHIELSPYPDENLDKLENPTIDAVTLENQKDNGNGNKDE